MTISSPRILRKHQRRRRVNPQLKKRKEERMPLQQTGNEGKRLRLKD